MMTDQKHPMQEILIDEAGTARFRENKIVRFLLDAGPFDLNQIALMPFDNDDRTQLAQLIGYSVSGFGELPYVDEELINKADVIAEEVADSLPD